MSRFHPIAWRSLMCLALLSSFPSHPILGGAQAQKKDPCRPTEELKAQISKMPGTIDPNLIKCVPLEVSITWEVEETYLHSTGFRDRVKLKLEDKFPARLELHYDPMKRDSLESFLIDGPSPCCPGEVEANLWQIRAHVQACTLGASAKCKPVTLDDPLLFKVTPQEDSFFGFSWHREGQVAEGGFGSSSVLYADNEVEKYYFASHHVLSPSHYRVNVRGGDALSWNEIQEGLDKEELATVFPLRESGANLMSGEGRGLTGQATLHIRFGEQEEERWRVRVEAQELDDTKPMIEYRDPKTKEVGKIGVRLRFDWQLEGEFVLRKYKKGREFKEGRVTRAGLNARLDVEPNDLYRCSVVPCANVKLVEVGDAILGALAGNGIKLSWPRQPSAACVLCSPRKSFLGKVPYQQRFGLNETMGILSREVLPLKNGYTKSGSVSDWLKYKIVLTRIE